MAWTQAHLAFVTDPDRGEGVGGGSGVVGAWGGWEGACITACAPMCTVCLRGCWPMRSAWGPMSVDEHLPSQRKCITSPFLLPTASSHSGSHHYGNRCSLSLSFFLSLSLSLSLSPPLGSACVQSERDLCRDSFGLHLFNVPHWSSLHSKSVGTKRGGRLPRHRLLGNQKKMEATGVVLWGNAETIRRPVQRVMRRKHKPGGSV